MRRIFKFGSEFFWALVVLGVLLIAFYGILSWGKARGGALGGIAGRVETAAAPH